jgi:hypothetical protein
VFSSAAGKLPAEKSGSKWKILAAAGAVVLVVVLAALWRGVPKSSAPAAPEKAAAPATMQRLTTNAAENAISA